ncbi:MAG: LysR family transcriptional regulator [Kordiimonadaceae bacterium]|nr:LysR family transcriptional regulator [Kordiimonadaceae bacterium]MBO6569218.1 LysR family transcriptional regulator [Kordiimonadaceae bacterium]MBO6964694.1 LysR family transcriptional regulator [Kordiimonadaceae bacterium]
MTVRMPSPAALRTFDAAARFESFKQAAQSLGVTPASVSHQIKILEQQLGFALFIRSVREVRLTAAGERLAQATNVAFASIEAALEDIGATENTLTLSTTPAFAALVLMPHIRTFEEANPHMRIQLDTSTELVDLNRDRRIDVAIRYGTKPEHDERLSATELARETYGVYCAPQIAEQVHKTSGLPFIETDWRSPTLPTISVQSWLEKATIAIDGAAARKILKYDQEHYTVQAGMAGQGLIFVSDLLVRQHLKAGWLVPFQPDVRVDGLSYYMVTTAYGAETLKVRKFKSWLRQLLAATE